MLDTLTDREFAIWLAAFFDAEGCVFIPKANSGIDVSVHNTFEPVMRALYKRLQMGQMTETRYINCGWKTKFSLRIRDYPSAKKFLQMLRPFLIIKADVADKAFVRIAASEQRQADILVRNANIVALLDQGWRSADVAKKYNVCVSRVNQIRLWIEHNGNVPQPHGARAKGDLTRQYVDNAADHEKNRVPNRESCVIQAPDLEIQKAARQMAKKQKVIYAFCWKNGAIQFDTMVPVGAIEILHGPLKLVTSKVKICASYKSVPVADQTEECPFVPGVSESQNDSDRLIAVNQLAYDIKKYAGKKLGLRLH